MGDGAADGVQCVVEEGGQLRFVDWDGEVADVNPARVAGRLLIGQQAGSEVARMRAGMNGRGEAGGHAAGRDVHAGRNAGAADAHAGRDTRARAVRAAEPGRRGIRKSGRPASLPRRGRRRARAAATVRTSSPSVSAIIPATVVAAAAAVARSIPILGHLSMRRDRNCDDDLGRRRVTVRNIFRAQFF